MKITSSSVIYNTIYYNGSYFFCFLEREHYKVLTFHLNNSSYFEISVCPSFKRRLLVSAAS